RDLGLGLRPGDAWLESDESLDPARAPILQLVSGRVEQLLHRGRDPELHRPAHESSVEVPRSNADDRVRQAIEQLSLAYYTRISVESLFPQLITDHRDRVRVASEILRGFEAAPENRPNSERLKIVGRYDAGGHALGSIAETQRGSRDPVRDERLE